MTTNKSSLQSMKSPCSTQVTTSGQALHCERFIVFPKPWWMSCQCFKTDLFDLWHQHSLLMSREKGSDRPLWNYFFKNIDSPSREIWGGKRLWLLWTASKPTWMTSLSHRRHSSMKHLIQASKLRPQNNEYVQERYVTQIHHMFVMDLEDQVAHWHNNDIR